MTLLTKPVAVDRLLSLLIPFRRKGETAPARVRRVWAEPANEAGIPRSRS